MKDSMQIVPINHVFTWKRKQQAWIVHLLMFMLLLLPFTGIFYLMHVGLLKPAALIEVLTNISLPPASVLAFIGLIALEGVSKKFYRSASLQVDELGVRLKLLPGSSWTILRFLERDIPWAELKDATLVERLKIIQFRPRSGLLPLNIKFEEWQLQNTNSGLNGGNAGPDLLKVLRDLRVFEKYPKNSQFEDSNFDLTKHPATKLLLAGIAILIAYSFVDVMLQHEEYAFFNFTYLLPHILSGLLVAVILAGLMFNASKRKLIPLFNIIGLAILSGMVFGVASHVGGIRINQLAGSPLLEARYHRDANCQNLLPEDPRLPVIEYPPHARNYWCSKNIDGVLLVKVREGLFGLYQLDLREHNQAILGYRPKT